MEDGRSKGWGSLSCKVAMCDVVSSFAGAAKALHDTGLTICIAPADINSSTVATWHAWFKICGFRSFDCLLSIARHHSASVAGVSLELDLG
jgi:hypothetical protein